MWGFAIPLNLINSNRSTSCVLNIFFISPLRLGFLALATTKRWMTPSPPPHSWWRSRIYIAHFVVQTCNTVWYAHLLYSTAYKHHRKHTHNTRPTNLQRTFIQLSVRVVWMRAVDIKDSVCGRQSPCANWRRTSDIPGACVVNTFAPCALFIQQNVASQPKV